MERKQSKPVGTVALMMLATLLSKVLGMLRSVLMASHYGTTAAANAFSQASHIPLTFFDLLFSAAILGCFIPVYNSFAENAREERSRFASTFLNAVVLLTGVLALLGILFAEPIIALMAPGFDAETAALATTLLRIMFPMILFTGSTYTLVGIMQSHGKYLLPAMISAVSNGAILLYFLFFDRLFGENAIYALAIAYLVAWSLQLATVAIPLWRDGFRLRRVLDTKDRAFRRALKMSPPIMIGSWMSPVGILLGLSFATLLEIPGAVTMFDYANTVYLIIAGTLSYSICNYIFPKLSRMGGEAGEERFDQTARTGILSAFFVLLPFAIGAFFLSGEGISILYQRNLFGATDAAYTAQALRCLTVAVPAFALIELISRIFYAKQIVSIPMIAALCGIAANAISSLILIRFPSLEVGAVAIANAIGQYTAAAVLIGATVRKIPGVFGSHFFGNLAKMLVCAVLSAITMETLTHLWGNDPFSAGILGNLVTALIVFLPGAGVYLLAAKLLRVRLTETLPDATNTNR